MFIVFSKLLPYIEFIAANAAALTGKYRSAQLNKLPMEGDMIRNFVNLETSEVMVKVFNFGLSVYAIALLAQVLQSYHLV